MNNEETPTLEGFLELRKNAEELQEKIRTYLESGQVKEMVQEAENACERYPMLTTLAVHCHLVALDFREAIRVYEANPTFPHPVVIWAIQKDVKNMADVGEAIFSRIRERQAKVENCMFELAGPEAGANLSNHKLTYTLVMEKTDQAVQLTREIEALRAQFPDWCPDLTIGFTSPELIAFQAASSGTLQ